MRQVAADAATMPRSVQRSLFGLCHRLRRLLEGVLEPGGGSLVVASDYDRALSPLITEAAAKPTSIGGPFAAQDLGIPCLLSMNMAVPSLSSRLSPDLGDKPPVQFESNPGLGCRRGRDVAHRGRGYHDTRGATQGYPTELPARGRAFLSDRRRRQPAESAVQRGFGFPGRHNTTQSEKATQRANFGHGSDTAHDGLQCNVRSRT
jgi:hypothetical protein